MPHKCRKVSPSRRSGALPQDGLELFWRRWRPYQIVIGTWASMVANPIQTSTVPRGRDEKTPATIRTKPATYTSGVL
jgi:hypothetical protein